MNQCEATDGRRPESACDELMTDLASGYGFDVARTVSGRLKLDLVRRRAGLDKTLCDVGCANGLHIRALAPHCGLVVGIDLNSRMLAEAQAALAREAVSNVHLIRANASSIPLADESCDVAYSFSTLLLVVEFDAALSEIARILRPGGVAIVDIAGRRHLSARYWRRWYRSQGHFGINVLSRRQVVPVLRRHGLEFVESHALGVTDQWKNLRGLHRATFLERLFHADPDPARNLDYRISNLPGLRRLASRWYVAARKVSS